MEQSDFYSVFCSLMRINGKVKMKTLAKSSELGLAQANKMVETLLAENKIKKIGNGRSTAYVFY